MRSSHRVVITVSLHNYQIPFIQLIEYLYNSECEFVIYLSNTDTYTNNIEQYDRV